VQGVGGIKSAADSLNKMRIMSQMTGTSLENMIQYTQASGILSKQIIGSTVGSAVSGEMISAIMASAAKGVWGVDDQVLGQVMTQRVTGAQLSQVSQGTAALLNLADKANISAERKEKLKAALMDAARNSPNPLTMEDIADIGKKYGVDISGQQLYQMTGLESTIKRAADDPTGTNVALANQAGQILSQRRDVLKAHLKKAGIAWRDDYAKMSLENIQKETQNNQNVNWKTVKTTLDNVADSLGRENDATAMAAIEATERAQRLQAAVDAEQRLASKPIYQAFGGGIAGVMKAFGAGKIGDADFKDLAFVFFGGLSEEQNKKAQKWLKGKQNDKNWMASVTGETSAIQTLTELVVGKTKEGTDLRNDRLNNLKGLMTPAQQIEYDKATTAEEKAAIIYDALKTSDDAEIEAAFGKDYKASQAFKNIKAGTGYGQKRRQDILNKAREAISIGKTLEGYEFLATNAQELFKNKLKYEEYLHESDPEKLEALAKEIKLSDGRSLYAKDAAHRKREKALEVELNKNSAQEKLRAAIADEWGTDILGTGSNDKKRKALLGYLTKAGGEDLFGKMNENERSRLRHDPEVFKEFIENNKGSIKRKLSGEEATAFLEEADKASERTSEDTMNEILAALKPIGDYFRDANKTLDSTIEDIKLAIKHVNIFSFLGADPLGGMR
jgi:hypothetical protein